MKNYKNLLDVILLLGLLVLTILAVLPKSIIMPTSAQMALTIFVLALLVGFVTFVWREKPEDERELQNQADASRFAYLIGSLVLIAALVIESVQHHVDPAVPIALFLMISTKLIVQRIKDK